MGSRHFAHLYISGLFRLRLGFLNSLGDLAFERRRDDRTVRASREDVTAAPALPHAGGTTQNGDRRAPRACVPVLQAFLDFLDPAADAHSIARAESGDDACLSRATGHRRPQDD